MESEYAAPWKVVPQLSGSENHRGYRIAASDGYYFADVYPIDSDGIRGLNRARLIEAAPDLLRACEVFAEAYRDYIDGDGSGLDYAARVVKGAIAKAEGGDK